MNYIFKKIGMCRTIQFLLLPLFFSLMSCANNQQKSPSISQTINDNKAIIESIKKRDSDTITWDYDSMHRETFLLGLILGSWSGTSGLFLKGGMGEIKLTPSSLHNAILAALNKRTQNSSHSISGAANNTTKTPSPTPNKGIIPHWGISETNEGQIITDWKSIQGKKAGLYYWEKTYQAEARHIITIKRSYRNPKSANFSITTEVRERPNKNYEWTKANRELGRASHEDIKNFLSYSILQLQLKSIRDKQDEN